MYVLIGALLAGCGANDDTPKAMSLKGDVSALYSNGRFVVIGPSETDSSNSSLGITTRIVVGSDSSLRRVSMPSISADGTTQRKASDLIYSSLDVIAEAEIAEDGTFTVMETVNEPRLVFFYILYATNENGAYLTPMKGRHFILEPGNLALTVDSLSSFTIEGGYYNDEVFNSWQQSEDYIEANVKYESLLRSVGGESEEERMERVNESNKAFMKVTELEFLGRIDNITMHPDPLVRKFTLQTISSTGPWYDDAIRELAQKMPDDVWVQNALIKLEAADVRQAQQAQFSEGNQIEDFEAYSLDGKTYKFSDVRDESKLVLLEFWASWCAPCITEIPHMKQAYERFKPIGFEIVSFTIDEEREAWALASEEQSIPWLDLGMGRDAPAAVAYGVTGIPKNFLVDAESGVIIATDLRQQELDKKLEEELL